MAGRDDAFGGEVVAPKTLMVSRVPNEHASRGPGTQLVGRRRGEVGVAQRTEDAEAAVVWGAAEEQLKWSGGAGRRTGASVDQIRCRGQCLGPERRRSCTVKERSVHTIVNSTYSPLGLAIRTGETKGDAVVGEQGRHGAGVKLPLSV